MTPFRFLRTALHPTPRHARLASSVCLASLALLGATQAQASAAASGGHGTTVETLEHLSVSQNRRLRELLHEQCLPEGEHTHCLSAGMGGVTGEATRRGTQQVGHVAAGWRVSEHFALGVNANLGRADLNTEAALQDRAYGLALWGAYHQLPHELGWMASASVAAGSSQNHFERDLGPHHEPAKADTDMRSRAVRLMVGYGFHVGSSVIAPELAFSHARTEQDGFTERNVAHPLTFQRAGSRETLATLGLHSATPVSPKASLHLGVAVEALLDEDLEALQGHSEEPGMDHFHQHSDFQKRSWLPTASLGYHYALSHNATLSGQVQAEASSFEHQGPVYGVGVSYHYSF